MTLRARYLTLLLALAFLAGPATLTVAEESLGLPMAEPESVGMSSEKLARIPVILSSFVDKGQVPGFVTVVARNGKIVHFEAFGSMDVERDKPMRKDTIFRMYSMTKPITGAAVMILVDEGKLKVSDPVSKYIPEFAEMSVLEVAEDGSTKRVPANTPITIKHLLTHTGGLIYGIFDTGPVGELYNESGINSDGASGNTLEEFAIKAAAMPLVSHPGTEWNYSISMDILGRVVEVVSGQRFGDFLQARIFGPLGMKDAGFQVPADKVDRFAANYAPTATRDGMTLLDDPATSRYLNAPSLDSGGGGMVSTASDYLRFAQMLVNGGELDGVRIISEAAAEEMTTNQLGPEFGDEPIKFGGIPISFKGVGFGYTGAVIMEGFRTTVFGGESEYSWGGYASTDFWIDKNEQLVGIILTQLLPTGTYPQRVIMHNAVYAAITELYGSENTD